MPFCIPKFAIEEFKRKLKIGELDPIELSEMSSAQRRAALEFLGPENARQANALFESKLLLKNKKQGMVTWAKKVSGISKEAKRDLLSRIERLGDEILEPENPNSYLEDLVSRRLGTEVSVQEAGKIAGFSKRIQDAKSKIPENSPIGSTERIRYGSEYVAFKDFIETLKVENRKSTFIDYVKNPGKVVYELAGASKSILASLDNSLFGRQGIKVLWRRPDVWTKNFLKSWNDIRRVVIGRDAINPIRADVYSRPNAISGNYDRMRLDIGMSLTEEAFPSSLPTRIPIIDRLFKASEQAYNGGALRLRADMADMFLRKAESQGIDLVNPREIQAIGSLVNSMTGRGGLGKLTPIGDELNVFFFSPKFLSANINTLIGHFIGKKSTPFVRKQAAINLATQVAGTAGVLALANVMWPGSVDFDPRSSNFGKIKIGPTRFDISGGSAAIITLASRIVPTQHNGKWGFWFKSSTTNKFTQLGGDDYGAKTAMDMIYNFLEGKTAPITRTMIDIYEGKNFKGEKPTPLNIGLGLITPIPITTYQELEEHPDAPSILWSMIMEGIGISTTTY